MYRKYSVNNDIFANDTEISFYLAGFIAADGCILNSGKRYKLKIKLSVNDRIFLNDVKKLLCSTNPIFYDKKSSSVEFTVSSKKILQDLSRFNILPRKSLTYTMPEWLQEHPFVNHFLRGYIDGDGSFYIKTFKNQISQTGFSLCGTKEFLEQTKNIFNKKCNVTLSSKSIRQRPNDKIHHLDFSGTHNISKIASFIYKDHSFCLERKRDIAILSHLYSRRVRTRGANGKFIKSVVI